MLKDYREPEDLLSDESFLSWYFQPGQSSGNEWDRWMEEEPGRKELVNQAIALLKSSVIAEKELPAGQLQRAEAALMERLNIEKSTPATVTPLAGRRHWRWIAAACILVVLTAGMVITRMITSRQEVLATRYGQLTQQQLPDGSEVTINANSRLRYAHNWKEGADREVWIEGEAFFHVRKTLTHSPFIVHTDRFDIVVTGTQFNVMSRPGKANVLLREGSVILHGKDGKEVDMVPGDFVQWDGVGLNKRLVQRDSVLAWKDRKLFFDKTPLKDVASLIEEQYGVQVRLSNKAIADSTITGIMPNNNLDVLLHALEATSEYDVTNDNGNILIKPSTH